MFGEKESKGVVIVYDKDTEEYAEYLYGLIGSRDDKNGDVVGVEDGTVHAVKLSEKAYNDTKNTITSDEYMIFIGSNKTTKSIIKNMHIKYNKFGMIYGWLGKRAVLYLSSPINKQEVYEEFLNHASVHERKFEKIDRLYDKMPSIFKKKEKKDGLLLGTNDYSLLGHIFPLPLVVGFSDLSLMNKIGEQQYTCLILDFYAKGLKEFLED